MAIVNRYSRAPKISNGRYYGTWDACYIIHRAASSRAIDVKYYVSNEGDRLDILAGDYYGDGTLWWVIGGASGIGWGLQVPAGTMLVIPTNIGQITALLG
jgi:hypothetical protein